MPREMLKLRKGDSAIMIKADGSIELAGVYDTPLVDERELSPLLFYFCIRILSLLMVTSRTIRLST